MRTFAERSAEQVKSANWTWQRSASRADKPAVHSIRRVRHTGDQQAKRFPDAEPEMQASTPTASSNRFSHDFSGISLHGATGARIQPRLAVSTPGDAYEQEADRIADRVTQMSEPKEQRLNAGGGECPKWHAERTSHLQNWLVPANGVQATAASRMIAPPIVNEVLGSPGQPLDAVVRAFFEPRFGRSFDDVRIHTDARANQSAQELSARAYTVGSQIVLGNSVMPVNARLMAHELAHVVQQSGEAGRPPLLVQRDGPPTYWFQDPASQRTAETGEGGTPMSTRHQRAQVLIDPPSELTIPNHHGTTTTIMAIRFAYPQTEASVSGRSPRILNAKSAISSAISRIIVDIGSFPEATRAESLRQQRVRARLRESMRGFTVSSPLNVYIATEPDPEELRAGQVAAFTDRIFVSLADVGNPARLEAAIRMPLLMLTGGALPGGGGVQTVPIASEHDLQRTMLHEALHALLIRRACDANAIWESNRARLAVQGVPSASERLIELVRKYLIAQEEVFAYENEASLYPPVSLEKAQYDRFITYAERFLNQRHLGMNGVSRSIPVSQRVAGAAVTWAISYRVPSGSLNLTAEDTQTLDLILSVYPLR